MRFRPISVFTIYHSDNAKTEISSRLLEIMKKKNCCLWADIPALAFLSIWLIYFHIKVKVKVISIAPLTCSPLRAPNRLFHFNIYLFFFCSNFFTTANKTLNLLYHIYSEYSDTFLFKSNEHLLSKDCTSHCSSYKAEANLER